MDNEVNNINDEIKIIERQINGLKTRLSNLKNKEKRGNSVRLIFRDIDNSPIFYIRNNNENDLYYDYATAQGDAGKLIADLAKMLLQEFWFGYRSDGYESVERFNKKIKINELSEFQYEIVKSFCNDFSKLYNKYFEKYHPLNYIPRIHYNISDDFEKIDNLFEKAKPVLEKIRKENFKDIVCEKVENDV